MGLKYLGYRGRVCERYKEILLSIRAEISSSRSVVPIVNNAIADHRYKANKHFIDLRQLTTLQYKVTMTEKRP